MVLAFWARLEKGEGGATTASLPYNAVQLASAPYSPLFTNGVTIGMSRDAWVIPIRDALLPKRR